MQSFPVQPYDKPFYKDKLWVTGFSPNLPDDELYEFCSRYGKFAHCHRPKNKIHVFLTYMTEEDAELAMKKFKLENINVNYAHNHSMKNGTSKQTDGNQKQVRFSNGNSNRQPNDSNGVERGSSHQMGSGTVFRSGGEVIITHVRKDFYFYAYPKAKDSEYKQLLETISQSATNAEPLTEIPKKRDLVLAYYNGRFHRALVTNTVASKSELVPVSIIDIGLTAQVPYHKLKVLPQSFTTVRITYRFCLDGCTEDANNAYAVECFRSFIKTTLKMECNESIINPSSMVRLIEPNTDQNINELMKQMTLGKSFTIDDQRKIPPPTGVNKELTVIDHSKLMEGYNFITFVEHSMHLEYLRQRNQTQNIAKILEKFPPYLPRDDELCFVKFNDYWYRGCFCEKTSDDTAIVLLFDLEKGVEVELTKIRKITQDFAEEPHLLFSAALHGYNNKINKEQADKLMQKFKIDDVVRAKSVVSEEDEEGTQYYSFKI